MQSPNFRLKLLFTLLLIGNAAFTSMDKEDLMRLKCTLRFESTPEFFGVIGVVMLTLTAFALLTFLAIERKNEIFDPLIPLVATVYANYKAIVVLANGFTKVPDRNLVIAVILAALIALAIAISANKRFQDQYYVFVVGHCYLLLFFATAMVISVLCVNGVARQMDFSNDRFAFHPGVANALIALPYLILSLAGYQYRLSRLVVFVVYGMFLAVIIISVPATTGGSWIKDFPSTVKTLLPSVYAAVFFVISEIFREKRFGGSFGASQNLFFVAAVAGMSTIFGSVLFLISPDNVEKSYMIVVGYGIAGLLTSVIIVGFEYFFRNEVLSRLPIVPEQTSAR